MIIDGCQHHLAEPLSFNQMSELADRRLVWRRLIPKIIAHQIPHRGAVIEAVLSLRVRHVWTFRGFVPLL
jgi:hypothetical protein